MSTLPPSWMSVPRPAMLVAMVSFSGTPASARWWLPARGSARSARLRDAADGLAVVSEVVGLQGSDRAPTSMVTVPTRSAGRAIAVDDQLDDLFFSAVR
jgi:hypothetical protein